MRHLLPSARPAGLLLLCFVLGVTTASALHATEAPGNAVQRAVRTACGPNGVVRARATPAFDRYVAADRRTSHAGASDWRALAPRRRTLRFLPPFLEDARRAPLSTHLLTAAVVTGAGALIVNGDRWLAKDVGDVLQFGLPTAAFASTVSDGGVPDLLRWGASFGTAIGTVLLMKETIHELRPNRARADAFPSGHSAVAFMGAAYIERRYGARYGVPAYLLAAFTSFSRVWGKRHDLDDVVAGASIGMLSSWLFARPRDVACASWRCSHPTRARYEFETGPMWQPQNEAQVPPVTGDFVRFETRDMGHPPFRARALYEWEVDPTGRHQLALWMAPSEVRDSYVLPDDVHFGGATFASGQRVFTRVIVNEYAARYRYEWIRSGRFALAVGASVVLTDAQFQVQDETQRRRTSELGLRPRPHVRASYAVGRHWTLIAEGEAWPVGDRKVLSALALLRWQVSDGWDLGIGYRVTLGHTTSDRVEHEWFWHGIAVQIGHSL